MFQSVESNVICSLTFIVWIKMVETFFKITFLCVPLKKRKPYRFEIRRIYNFM